MPLSFGSGISALNAARTAITTIGHNLANASTPGYSRERVLLGSLGGGLYGGHRVGGGVEVTEINRVTDDLLTRRVLLQQHEVARRETQLQNLIEVEQVFGEPGQNGISALLGGFFQGLSALSASPEDSATRGGAVEAAATLAERFRRVHSELDGTLGNISGQIAATTREINGIADSLANINRQLTLARGSGGPPPELLDQQQQLLESLSDLVDVHVRPTDSGRIDVNVGGQMIVTADRSLEIALEKNSNGDPEVSLENAVAPLEVRSGRLRALLDLSKEGVSGLQSNLDELSRSMIQNVNRIHATGVPPDGGYHNLRAAHAVKDRDGDGSYLDELLSRSNLPFDVRSGRLFVNIVDEATGAVTQSAVDIDPDSDTVGELVDRLSAIPGLGAAVDATGRLVLTASAGKQFHFASALPTNPDAGGTFGSASAMVMGASSGPFALSLPADLSITVDGGVSQNLSLNAGQFANPAASTVGEIAAAINAQLSGATARTQDGRLVIESNTTGVNSTIQVTDGGGSPAATLGIPTSVDTGSSQSVAVETKGQFTGESNDQFRFRPTGDGTIGVTPGLQVEVLDSAGDVVALLDVGQGYAPGDDLDVGRGIIVSFSSGEISASSNEAFQLEIVAESDSSDVLVAFGLAALFTGTGAADIAVSDRVLADPGQLALGLGPSELDNRNVLRLLGLRDGEIAGLGNRSMESYYEDVVSRLGNDVSRSELAFETESLLMDSYRSRLEQVRGVSIDEELANLQRYEQAYAAAARFVTAVNEVSQILLNI
ncbi:MAG: flagellar hook-associated protein FlgK [Planctomycetes bacterium]|nr:flagellar hook-associated protein FlgK [Planctomycetota bacterium]